MSTITPQVGDRICLAVDVDRYPHFVAEQGNVGVVTEVTADTVFARMAATIPGCETWNNEIEWMIGADGTFADFYAQVEFLSEDDYNSAIAEMLDNGATLYSDDAS